MNKIIAPLQLIASLLLALIALATGVNLIFIVTRPETISVVNVMIGQGVLIVCLSAISRVLFKKGLAGLKQAKSGANSESIS